MEQHVSHSTNLSVMSASKKIVQVSSPHLPQVQRTAGNSPCINLMTSPSASKSDWSLVTCYLSGIESLVTMSMYDSQPPVSHSLIRSEIR